MNAIMNKNSADLSGCTLYVALFPCNECAKLIIQSRIKQVVYLSDKHKSKPSTEASKLMFDMAGVKYHQFVPKNSKIVIDFEEIDWNISKDWKPKCDHVLAKRKTIPLSSNDTDYFIETQMTVPLNFHPLNFLIQIDK